MPAHDPSRRAFLTGLAAAATLGACGDGPPREAVAYVEQPENVIPGEPLFFATAIPLQGYAQPVLAESHMGRPTKLEGNPRHPASRGATDAFVQAAVAELYGPDRSRAVLAGDDAATWADFAALAADAAGPGLRILTGTVTSPTLARQLGMLADRGVRWHVHEPVATVATVEPGIVLLPRLDRARVVVSVGEDLLGPGPCQVWNVARWAEARRREAGGLMLVAEPTPTLTGTAAADRLAVPPSRLDTLVRAIGAAFGVGGAAAPPLSERERAWVEKAVRRMGAAGARSLLAVGPAAGAEAGALALAVNRATGALGDTMTMIRSPAVIPPDGAGSFQALLDDMRAGVVERLLILDSNPAYTAPPAFRAALARVPTRYHAGPYRDETARLCHWHVPLAHALEDWSDARAVDGTVTVIQPLIRALGGISAHTVLSAFLGAPAAPLETVEATWRTTWNDGFEDRWAEALREGFIVGTAAQSVAEVSMPQPRESGGPAGPGLEVVFLPDPSVWDGRYAAVPWLQELPKPLTKVTWDNVISLPAAQALWVGAGNGDLVEVVVDGRSVSGAAWIMPGQAEDTLTLFLGYGRTAGAGLATGRGYDAYAVRPDGAVTARGATVRRLGGASGLAVTQLHQTLAGRTDIVRTVGSGETAATDHPTASLHPPWPDLRPAWGMVIDLDLCTGCNACVVACQMENSVPYVGPEEVARGRAMHWLRVDVYHEADGAVFAPVPCMHCEQAPCELGCPVNATVHGPEGLNQMVYARCIGTRTCSSYCPWKVRRFNFFDYAGGVPDDYRPQRNPDVTVRGRGVMEKCTYCVQRISAARIEARVEGRAVAEGAVRTACQQACPARAIAFGDLGNPDSAVSRARADGRHYAMLGELGTRPRTTYLARRRRA